MRHLVIGILILHGIASCTLGRYQKAQEVLRDCVNGIKAPADEFCSEWNHKYWTQIEKVELKLVRLALADSSKYQKYLNKIQKIDQNSSVITGVSEK